MTPSTVLPRNREGKTFAFRIINDGDGGGSSKGYLTVNEDDDGKPIEVFLRLTKEGSTLGGFTSWVSILISKGLQNDVPLIELIRTPMGTRFEPHGKTDDPDVPHASSLADYVCRKLAATYCTSEERKLLHEQAIQGRLA